jgi:cytochrome c553
MLSKGTGIMKIYHLTIISLLVLISGYCYAGDPAKGKTLSQTCAVCHSIDGNSINPAWPKLAGQHAGYIVKQLQDFKEGKRVNAQMTAMVAPLSEQDMTDLAAYFTSQKAKSGSAKPELIESGQRIYRAGDSQAGIPACMACHGPAGAGNPGALYPSLAGQHAEYTAIQLKAFKSEERNNDANNVMRSIAGPMTNAQIEAVSEYIQGLH